MCGIVGIYLKSKKFEKSLGGMLSKMLVSMESRGPDSAGFAIYNSDKNKIYKYSVCLNEISFEKFKKEIKKKVKFTTIEKNSDHVILKSIEKPNKILPILEDFSTISLVGYGKSIEIFKQVGKPSNVVKKFNLDNWYINNRSLLLDCKIIVLTARKIFLNRDVNFDNLVNINDIIIVINFILHNSDPTSEQFLTADMNQDEIINILDVIQIVNVILNSLVH